ncbi:MAG: hypothetical protein WD052_09860 [Bacteroidales bacterium]
MRAIYNILIFVVLVSITAFLPQDTPDEVMDCASKAGPSAIYLKDFHVELPEATEGERPPMFRQAVVLRGNNIYRFNLCNKQGEAVIRIYDSNRLLLSSYNEDADTDYNPIQFLCNKTGPYNIVITFKKGEPGEAIGIMSHVKASRSNN